MSRISPGALYDRSPRVVQSVAVAAMGAYLDWQRHGGGFDELLAEAERTTFADETELRRVREREWNARMRAAVAAVRAYGGRPLSLDDVARLPVLTKQEVRAQISAFTRAVPRWSTVSMHTSGTTGAGLQFAVPLHAVRREYAFAWRYRRWHGIQRGEWCAMFGGRTVVPPRVRHAPYWHENPVGRSTLYSQYHLNESTIRSYVEHLQRTRVRWIHGYPSVVGLLSRLAVDAGLARSTQVRWVTLSSESLLDAQRRSIAEMFGVQPVQQYGSTESVALVSECPEARLHVDEDYSCVEFLPLADDPARSRIIGTTLANDAFPLLRYDLGDLVEVSANDRCPCGRPGRVVRSIDGRREDFVVLADGSRVGRVDHFFKDAVNVKEAQIVQRRPGHAVLRIVRGSGWSAADEHTLRDEIRARVADLLQVEFDYVESIERTRAGKLRLVVSELTDGRLAADGPP